MSLGRLAVWRRILMIQSAGLTYRFRLSFYMERGGKEGGGDSK